MPAGVGLQFLIPGLLEWLERTPTALRQQQWRMISPLSYRDLHGPPVLAGAAMGWALLVRRHLTEWNGKSMPEHTELTGEVERILGSTLFIDIHTHLFPPSFGGLGLWGIDELLTYHYLEAELFRFSPVEPADYWRLDKLGQADLIWRTLFVDTTPLSEAARGVVAVLRALGLDASAPTLDRAREFFHDQKLEDYVPLVFRLAGVSHVVMTNDPLDPAEASCWTQGVPVDPRYIPAVRLDRILNQMSDPAEVRRFVLDWARRIRPAYMAVSLEDTFRYPGGDTRSVLLRDSILPACRELDIPLSLMIGVRRQVNPALRLAGDASGQADLRTVEVLCRDFPRNRFLVSVLSRENQHELCVYARKFRNLVPFGCWWFLNNPSVVEEITRERLEMLGVSFIPQHSDARVFEQIIYKWRNTRRTLAPILANAYDLLAQDRGRVTSQEIERDVNRLFRGNFEKVTGRASA